MSSIATTVPHPGPKSQGTVHHESVATAFSGGESPTSVSRSVKPGFSLKRTRIAIGQGETQRCCRALRLASREAFELQAVPLLASFRAWMEGIKIPANRVDLCLL